MSESSFEKLTPTNTVDLNGYKEALDFVFENGDVRNVAISGAYSSGKSSIIESYKKDNKNRRFMHISLAHFNEYESADNDSSEEEQGNKIKESVLEGKILNQLIHQIDAKKIPQTNFRIKRSEPNRNISIITIISMLFFISLFHIICFESWSKFINELLFKSETNIDRYFINLISSVIGGGIVVAEPEKGVISKIFEFTINPYSILISGMVLLIIIGIIIYNFIKIERDKSIFKRFSFQGNEIEIFEKSDESYFDKYLNEVLYIFENSEVDVIAFEDIDRYNSNHIFQRLKEVNTLVNIKKVKKGEEPLRFFYLIKDDIFESKDRTKFFDFIIPVIPVVDSSNSFNEFIAHFKKVNLLDKFDRNFLQGLSLYVDDMRVLKNIHNEFLIYHKRIVTTEQDCNKLLAIVVYKNIFPKDFSDTQINIGLVWNLFNSKNKIIKSLCDDIHNKIDEIKEMIEKCNKEYLENIEELDHTFRTRNAYTGGWNVDISNSKYIERKKRIEVIENKQVGKLEEKINELNKEKDKLKSKSVKELITRENIDEVFNISYKNFLGEENTFKELKSSQYFDIIKYLIRNGYIDETYEDYMTYFKAGSLTANDKMFLRSITDKKAKEWQYRIDNANLILTKLNKYNFLEEETLNFELFTAILESNVEEFRQNFYKQLKSSENYKFIKEYIYEIDNHKILMKSLSKYWDSFIADIIDYEGVTEADKFKMILKALYWCSDNEIDKFNEEHFIEEYVSENNDFLTVNISYLEKLIAQFIRLNIKFKQLKFDNNDEFIDGIYKNNLYELTFDNLSMLLINKFNINNITDIKEKTYTIIKENELNQLDKYINENILAFMEVILDNCNQIIRDNIEIVKEILNNNNISIDIKERYIEYLQTNIEDLSNIQNKILWRNLIVSNLVIFNKKNILYYFFKSGNKLDEALIKLINSGEYNLELNLDDIDNEYGEGSSEMLFDEIIKEERINDFQYKQILKSLEYFEQEFDIEDLPIEKVKILIECHIISMTVENVRFFREHYKELTTFFIEKNIKTFIKEIAENINITKEELNKILYSDIDEDDKIELLKYYDCEIPVIASNYTDKVKKYILKNNFCEAELLMVIEEYENADYEMQKIIKELVIAHKEIIIEIEAKLSKDLFKEVFINEELDLEEKINLFANNIGNLVKVECEELFKAIDETEYAKIFNNGRPKVEVNNMNEFLLEAVKKIGFIKEYEANGNVYRISKAIQKKN